MIWVHHAGNFFHIAVVVKCIIVPGIPGLYHSTAQIATCIPHSTRQTRCAVLNGVIEMPNLSAQHILSQFQQISQQDPEFFEKSQELVLECRRHSQEAASSYDFARAYDMASAAAKIVDGMSPVLELMISEDQGENGNEVRDVRNWLHNLKVFASFQMGMSEGQMFRMQGNHASSMVSFQRAMKALSESSHEFDAMTEFLYALVNYQITLSEGFQYLERGNTSMGLSALQRAQIAIENIVQIANDQASDIKASISTVSGLEEQLTAEYRNCMALYYQADAYDLFQRDEFAQARDQYRRFIEHAEETIARFSAFMPTAGRSGMNGMYHLQLGFLHLTEGEWFREGEHWEKAMSSYQAARSAWTEATQHYLRAGMEASQQRVLNQIVYISKYVRRCNRERELKERLAQLEHELDELQDTLASALRHGGVTVNNTQEMTSQVMQNMTSLNTIQENALRSLDELKETVAKLPVEEAVKKEIISKADDVAATEKGTPFLKKVREFTDDVKEIVGNVKELAEPLMPFITMLSLLR